MSRRKVLLAIIVGCLLLASLSPLLVRGLFFDMPGQSANFDCDDSTLFMVQRLSRIGIEATPMLGKITATGETYSESDHVWVMADILWLRIPLDWGNLQVSSQHFEGYPLTNRQLLRFVEQDRRGQSMPANNPE